MPKYRIYQTLVYHVTAKNEVDAQEQFSEFDTSCASKEYIEVEKIVKGKK